MLVIIILICVTVICVYAALKGQEQKSAGDTNIKVESCDVTVEDMVLHDMNNNDDTFDIGTIDFND